jgi:hypothetical protein
MLCSVIGTKKCRCETKSNGETLSCVTEHSLIRKLFSDHSWYTQDYIQAVIFKLKTAPALRARLLENQTEIGKELGGYPVIGVEYGAAIGRLLTEHIAKAEAVVKAAIRNRTRPLALAKESFFSQGDRMSNAIAAILGIDAEGVRALFQQHNQQVINLTTLLLKKMYDKEYTTELDRYQNHMMYIADVIYVNIIALEEEKQYEELEEIEEIGEVEEGCYLGKGHTHSEEEVEEIGEVEEGCYSGKDHVHMEEVEEMGYLKGAHIKDDDKDKREKQIVVYDEAYIEPKRTFISPLEETYVEGRRTFVIPLEEAYVEEENRFREPRRTLVFPPNTTYVEERSYDIPDPEEVELQQVHATRRRWADEQEHGSDKVLDEYQASHGYAYDNDLNQGYGRWY